MKDIKQKKEYGEIYFSVDIETSGPVPHKYSMLSLGACIVGHPEITFYVEIVPISDTFLPEALKISGLSLDYLKKKGKPPKEVMVSFKNWIVSNSKGKIPIFVGFNAPFDWQFVNWYFYMFLNENPFGINAIDIKAYFMGANHTSWGNASSRNLPDWLKVENKNEHNALSDAISQGIIFERLLEEGVNEERN